MWLIKNFIKRSLQSFHQGEHKRGDKFSIDSVLGKYSNAINIVEEWWIWLYVCMTVSKIEWLDKM